MEHDKGLRVLVQRNQLDSVNLVFPDVFAYAVSLFGG